MSLFIWAAAAPAWVQWFAQDADGRWWGYAHAPNQSERGWYENEIGDCIALGIAAPNPNWEQSLIRRDALLHPQ